MYLVLDLETSSKEKYGKRANCFYNQILCIGLKYQKRNVITLANNINKNFNFYIDINHSLIALPIDYMPVGWLDNITILIGHNIGFDLKYIWKNDELQDFFKRGGRIWDTAAAEFILSKQEHKFPGLRDIAVNKYKCKERVKHIEKLFESGLDTTQGDIDLLLEDVKNDVLDTEKVALQQVKLAKELGMFNLIVARMDSLLATTEMEYNGVKVDKEIFTNNKQHLIRELEVCKKELDQLVTKYWK